VDGEAGAARGRGVGIQRSIGLTQSLHTPNGWAQAAHTEKAAYKMHTAAICAQVVIALSIAFVWIVRLPNIVIEFDEYGLPDLIRNSVGAAKICLATLLITGIWYPRLVPASALLMAFLMLCAQIAHLRAKHSWQRYMPSLGLLLLSLFVYAVASGKLSS